MLRIQRHPDGTEPPREGGFLCLDAESDWVVEGSPEEVGEVVADLGTRVCQRVASGAALLRFGNSVGLIDRAGALGALRIRSGKWTEQDYDHLLDDLSRVTAALPFAPASPSSLPYERTTLDTPDVLYHAFVWLRHTLLRENDTEIHDALEGILRDPHRRLVRTSHEIPVDLAGRLSVNALVDIASGRWPVSECSLGFRVGSQRLRPLRVTEDRARASVDTGENRFVKAFLVECAWVVDRVRLHLGCDDDVLGRRVRRDCDRIAELVTAWLRASMWSEVGNMAHFPASSTVLQRRREYRSVLRHHLMLRLGSRVPLDPEITARLLESKDVATLYELWATFVVLNEVTRLLGPPQESARMLVAHDAVSVKWGLLAKWADGTEVAFNHSYTRKSGFHGRSRSLRVRPDVALYVPVGANAGLHLFDAKFRLSGAIDSEGVADDVTFHASDLHKMHAYRDAIPAARTAWIVYPGTNDAAYFDDGRRGVVSLANGPLAGVGALSLRPNGTADGLRAVLCAATATRRSTPMSKAGYAASQPKHETGAE